MNCQILFSRKNKKSIISLSSAEFAHSMVSVNNSKWFYFIVFFDKVFFTDLC